MLNDNTKHGIVLRRLAPQLRIFR